MKKGNSYGLWRVLRIGAAVAVYFSLVSIYSRGLGEAGLGLVAIVPAFLLGPFLFFNPLYFSPLIFGAALALTVFLAVVVLWRAQPARLLRLYLLVGVLFLLASPLLLPSLYGEYTLHVEPQQNYTMIWLTRPEGAFASAFKSAQRVHEVEGCTYHLLGWSTESALYYRSDCGEGVWRFDPGSGESPVAIARVPAGVTLEGDVRGMIGNQYPGPPLGFPPGTYNHTITYETVRSPDGRWEAAAIMNYYGPSDVVVLSRESEV